MGHMFWSLCHGTFSVSGLAKAQKAFSQNLIDFKFECIGQQQTDDEIIICKYTVFAMGDWMDMCFNNFNGPFNIIIVILSQ